MDLEMAPTQIGDQRGRDECLQNNDKKEDNMIVRDTLNEAIEVDQTNRDDNRIFRKFARVALEKKRNEAVEAGSVERTKVIEEQLKQMGESDL